MKTQPQSSWAIQYQNEDNKLSNGIYELAKKYATDKFRIGAKSYFVPEGPLSFYVHGENLSNVDVILFFQKIFNENPEYKKNCVWFSARSEITIVESIDLKRLVEA